MKITGFRHRAVSVPVKYPVVSSVRQSSHIIFVLLDICTDEGINGISYAQAFHNPGAKAIRSCLKLLETVVVGEDPLDIEKIWKQMWESTKLLGHQGLSTFALSMVDMALWDLKGKSLRLPIYKLIGREQFTLDAYASDGLWLVPPSEAAKQAEVFADMGFSSIKLRLGRTNPKEDLETLVEVRKAVGDEIEIIGDANQGWTREETIEMGNRLHSYGLNSLEEPIEAEDMEGYMIISHKLEIPVSTGENLYGVRPFHRFLQTNSASLYTPDLQRIGGISGWRRIDVLSEQYKRPYSMHLFPQFAVHLLAPRQSSAKLEWMSWANVLFQAPPQCIGGKVKAEERPGFGMEWDETQIAKLRVI